MSYTSILPYLSEIPDTRRKQGLRYSQDEVILLALLGTLAGRVGYRAITRFCKRHEVLLTKVLALKHGVPSHVSMTSIVESVNPYELEKAINKWGLEKLETSGQHNATNDILSLDGKAIKCSIKNGVDSKQSFVACVNAYSSKNDLVIASKSYDSGITSEHVILRSLISEMGLKDVIFTADAAHPSKKL